MMWKNGKRRVYSITYDERCEDLLQYALPSHREYGIPGHVAFPCGLSGEPDRSAPQRARQQL